MRKLNSFRSNYEIRFLKQERYFCFVPIQYSIGIGYGFVRRAGLKLYFLSNHRFLSTGLGLILFSRLYRCTVHWLSLWVQAHFERENKPFLLAAFHGNLKHYWQMGPCISGPQNELCHSPACVNWLPTRAVWSYMGSRPGAGCARVWACWCFCVRVCKHVRLCVCICIY